MLSGMNLQGTKVLVTGANRGLGRALVEQLLERGAATVYAAARTPGTLSQADRVVPIQLDITSPTEIAAAATRIPALDLLINNAGLLASFNIVESTVEAIERDMQTNYWGTLAVTRALLPAIEKSKGAIANVLTVASLAAMPAHGGYSASKAAAFSLTQALRGDLAKRGLRVHAVFPGPIDTDMIKGFDLPKTSAADVARATLDGIARGDEDIFPDPMAASVGAEYAKMPKSVEKMFAAM
jgi:NAD(P)-dependent dehydrogenase (short-subunit alcohol dehydrogenase family)